MRKNSIREVVFKNDQLANRLLDPRGEVRDKGTYYVPITVLCLFTCMSLPIFLKV